MAHRFHLNIADILIEVDSELPPSELGILNKFSSFIGSIPNPSSKLSLRWERMKNEPIGVLGDLVFSPGSFWKMYRKRGEFYALIEYSSEANQALLIADDYWNNLVLQEKVSNKNWISLLNMGAGELILRAKVPQTGGLMLHSAAIDYKGRGVVFAGHSGEGKSTMATLWQNEPETIVMNDDRIVVRAFEDRALCYGTPWVGTTGVPHNHFAPLQTIVLLGRAHRNEIVELSLSQAFPLLMSRSFIPWWDEKLVQLSIDNLERVLSLTQIYLFRFRPEKEAIELLKSVL